MVGRNRGGDVSKRRHGVGCSICGADISLKTMQTHRCSERVLRAIDAAHARGEDWTPPENRTIGDRIAEGAKMLGLSEDDPVDS